MEKYVKTCRKEVDDGSMRIKELRKATGMTQKTFSEYLGIPCRTIQNWEIGNRKCPEYLVALNRYKLEQEKVIRL